MFSCSVLGRLAEYTAVWIMQATSESAIKRAALLSDMHLRNLRQKLQLKQRMDEISKKLEVCCQSSFSAVFVCLFFILMWVCGALVACMLCWYFV